MGDAILSVIWARVKPATCWTDGGSSIVGRQRRQMRILAVGVVGAELVGVGGSHQPGAGNSAI